MKTQTTFEIEQQAAQPKPAVLTNRIDSVDIIRGVALLGILLLNIPSFSMPQQYFLTYVNQLDNPDYWVSEFTYIFFGGKMRALFSAVFGAGIILFVTNKEKSGKSSTWLFYKRMFWLALCGFAHAHLSLWGGDILYFYGLIGMLAFLFRKMKPKYLAMGVPLVIIIGFVMGTNYYQDIRQKRLDFNEAVVVRDAGETLSEEQEKAIAAWEKEAERMLPDEERIAKVTGLKKGSYTELANYIRPKIWEGQTKYFIYSIWDMLALMLLGIALYKWGFFTLKWTTAQYKKTVWVGYGIGLPLVIFASMYYNRTMYSQESYIAYMEQNAINWVGLTYDIQRIAIMMAHVALVFLLYQKGYFKRLMNGLRAVGQLAFTNYIMQTVICALVFFGYGLNQFAEWRLYQVYYLVIGIWILQLVISPIWLHYFLFGPLEWLWRCLTYWRIQPFRRKKL